MLLSTIPVPIYSPINIVQGFPSLHILTVICYFLMIAILTCVSWYLIVVLICISLAILSIFSCTCWPPVAISKAELFFFNKIMEGDFLMQRRKRILCSPTLVMGSPEEHPRRQR